MANEVAPALDDWDTGRTPVAAPSPTYRSSADGRLVSYSRRSPGITAAAFLEAARGSERFFWEDVRDQTTFAGFGAAGHVMAWGANRFNRLHEQATALFADTVLLGDEHPLATPRLFGGFAFRDDFLADNTWTSFHQGHFILPHYQLVQVQEESWLTINVLLSADEDPAGLRDDLAAAWSARYAALQQPPPPAGPPPELLSLDYPLTYTEWERMINAARDQIAAGALQKVVLARVAEARFKEKIGVNSALAYLNQHYHDSYRFLFEPRPHHAFLGASPELLAKVKGSTITSMALAGSIGRSPDEREDTRLGQTLLESGKDRHEHDLVILSIAGRLAPLCAGLDISPQPGLLKLRNIQHLYTPVRGKLFRPGDVLPVVAALHPTAALGGRPRSSSLAFIREHEPAPRGWYGGPIGWVDYRLEGAFSVGIRSAVIQDRRAWLYAGSGIVTESNPEKEWAETALKFEPMLQALGIGR